MGYLLNGTAVHSLPWLSNDFLFVKMVWAEMPISPVTEQQRPN